MNKRDAFDYSSATIPPGALFVEDESAFQSGDSVTLRSAFSQ